MRRVHCCWLLAAIVLAAACALAAGESDPGRLVFPQGEYIGNIDTTGFNEPSGIVFHAGRGTLFVVGDEGDIGEMSRDGKMLKQAHLMDADLEGVTFDPATGLLYLAVEGEEKIVEVDPEALKVLREFPIGRQFEGFELLKPGGQGVEAITFVPDASHPQGGTFYLANQGFSFDWSDDPSVIVEVVAPIRGGSEAALGARIVRAFSIGVADLSGMCHDAKSDRIYAISDATNTFWEITRAGEIVCGYAFPGENQEGLTVDPEGWVYVAQDSGGIVKFKWNKEQ